MRDGAVVCPDMSPLKYVRTLSIIAYNNYDLIKELLTLSVLFAVIELLMLSVLFAVIDHQV